MINVFPPFKNGDRWQVWSDTEVSEDGRCIGSGKTKVEALRDAHRELREDLGTVSDLLSKISYGPFQKPR